MPTLELPSAALAPALPKGSAPERGAYRRQMLAAWLVLAVGLLCSVLAWRVTQSRVEREAELNLRNVTAGMQQALDGRIRGYVDALSGIRALLTASGENISERRFLDFVASLELSSRYPGIYSVNYGQYVTAAQKPAYEAAMRRSGYPQFAIRPPGQRDEHLVLQFVAPLTPAVLGFDMMADPARRETLQLSRDSGRFAVSGKILLLTDDINRPAFAIRLPVYRRDAVVETAAQRHVAFDGMVSATFIVADLMHGLFPGSMMHGLHLRLHDLGGDPQRLEPPSPQNLLFDSRPQTSAAADDPEQDAAVAIHTQTSMLEVGGRRWLLQVTADSATGSALQRGLPWMVLLTGLLVSILLAGLVRSLATAQARARAIAGRMTRDLRDSEARLVDEQRRTLELLEAIPNPIFFKGIDGRYAGVNKAWETFFGREREKFIGRTVHDLYPQRPEIAARLHALDQELWRDGGTQVYETAVTNGQGRVLDVVFYKATYTHRDGSIAGLIGTIIDITERKATEQRFRALFDNAAVGIVTVSREGVITDANQRFLDMLGYIRDELAGKTVREITHPDDWQQGMQTRQGLVRKGTRVVKGEKRFIRKDGVMIWARRTLSTVLGKDGLPDYLIDVIEDITDRKLDENRWAMEYAVTHVLADEESLDKAIPEIIRIICERMGWEFGLAWQRDRKDQFLRCRLFWGSNAPEVQPFIADSLQRVMKPEPGDFAGLVRRAYNTGEPVWIGEIQSSQGFRRARLIEQAGLRGAFAMPLLLGREVLGVMEFYHRGAVTPDPALAGTAQSIGRQIGQYIVRREAEESLKFFAAHDTLTGLPNRMMFGQRLEHALLRARRAGSRLAVLFIDLDRFKTINDTLGHEAGDALLREVATRLQGQLRASDTVARLGGDEFVVLIENVAEPVLAGNVAGKLIAVLSAGFELAGGEYNVTASIGISTYPDDGQDAQTLLQHADIAMYRAKEQSRNTFQFYSAQMNTHSVERLTLESGLRHALERNQLLLHFQPIVDLRTRQITGMETLVRWQHPELGLVMPGQFIPIAEETGLIVPLGKWVLETACAVRSAWEHEGLPPVMMAVNLSPRQFMHGDLVSDVAQMLGRCGYDPAGLKLEITESMVMHDPERAVSLMRELKTMGLQIAIDDFGTGYSSLAYLRRFPIDTLKIDRSFITDTPQDPGAVAITQAIIAMAHSLGLNVIAEGVETREQFEFLRGLQCDQMQGYYFSRPVPVAEAAALLRRQPLLHAAPDPGRRRPSRVS